MESWGLPIGSVRRLELKLHRLSTKLLLLLRVAAKHPVVWAIASLPGFIDLSSINSSGYSSSFSHHLGCLSPVTLTRVLLYSIQERHSSTQPRPPALSYSGRQSGHSRHQEPTQPSLTLPTLGRDLSFGQFAFTRLRLLRDYWLGRLDRLRLFNASLSPRSVVGLWLLRLSHPRPRLTDSRPSLAWHLAIEGTSDLQPALPPSAVTASTFGYLPSPTPHGGTITTTADQGKTEGFFDLLRQLLRWPVCTGD